MIFLKDVEVVATLDIKYMRQKTAIKESNMTEGFLAGLRRHISSLSTMGDLILYKGKIYIPKAIPDKILSLLHTGH